MKNILFILYYIIYSCAPVFGAATTTITADSIRSSNRTKTWTPPSITDVLTGLTDVQTLTNKTLTSPTINTPLVDVDTFTEQGSVPATPAAGKRKVYAKADGIYHLDSAGNERKVGSGSGGGDVSFITNGNADDANASIFVPYADAAATRPVDGTGGSPTVTTSITSTVPLVGTKSYLLTKPASNVQGQGWAIPFTVDLGYRAKASKITVQYIVNSGTFVAGSDSTESDVIWYLYDVTNSVLIEPSNIKMRASNTAISDQYEAEFQTSATGSSYRLIAHVQSVSALAYELKVDEIKVSPNKVTLGPVNSDPQNATCTASWTTNTTTTCKVERDGGFASIEWNVALSGAPNATTLSLSLPSGMVIDMARLVGVTAGFPQYGTASSNRSGSATTIIPILQSTTGIYITFISNTTTWAQSVVSNTAPVTWGTGDNINARIRVPIVGWGSSQRISDGYDGRDLRVNVQRSASLTGINPNNSTVKIPIAPSVIDDSYAGWDAANNRILIKSSRTYDVSFSLGVDIANQVASNYISARVRKNGTTDVAISNQQATGFYMGLTGSMVGIPLVAGDYLELFLNGTANNSASTLTVNTIVFNVSARQAPTTISAQDKMYLFYQNSSGQSIANATQTTLTNWTKVNDSHNSFNGTTGIFTAPFAGTFEISSMITFGDTVSAGDRNVYIRNITGSVDIVHNIRPYTASASGQISQNISATVDLVAGQQIAIQVVQGSGSAQSVVGIAVRNYISIKQIK